jgi:hypothetical protein
MEMEPWEVWVRSTELHALVKTYWWIWPVCETLHYFGLSLLLGTVGLFDLRVLGMARGIPPITLHRLIPFGIAGFVLNALTGIVFFFGHPDQYFYNNAFRFKAAFMLLAGINVLVFYSSAFREVSVMGAGADAPLRSKIITGISLGSWVCVLICGRLLTFYRPPFFH